MKVLLFGPPTTDGLKTLGENVTISGGGWVENLVSLLKQESSVELFSLFYCNKLIVPLFSRYDNVTYIGLPERVKGLKYCNKKMVNDLRMVYEKVSPDVVHIIGTEREHNYALFKIVGSNKCIISITGIVGECAKNYFAGMKKTEYCKVSLGDFIRRTSIRKEKKLFEKWSVTEKKLIKEGKFFMGRTDFDKSYIEQLNPNARYYFCSEVLNDSFYDDRWDGNKVIKYSIFVSQASYPLKGFHTLLKAMPLVLEKYPESVCFVAGANITKSDSIIDKIKKTSYSKYISKLIKTFDLNKHIKFLGPLSSKQMKEQYEKCNVFVLPSHIENSSNALGEAMSLGMPIVASFVGGTPSLVEHNKSAFLFPCNDERMLAHYICKIFEEEESARLLGESAYQSSKYRFNRDEILNQTLCAYKELVENNEKQ